MLKSLSAGKYSSPSTIGKEAYGRLAAGHSSSSSLEAKISTMPFVALDFNQCDTANIERLHAFIEMHTQMNVAGLSY